jgi:hypothetical protein
MDWARILAFVTGMVDPFQGKSNLIGVLVVPMTSPIDLNSADGGIKVERVIRNDHARDRFGQRA